MHESEISMMLQKHLLPGEQLLWSGRPRQGLVWRTADWFHSAIGVVFTIFAGFWNYNLWAMTVDAPFAFGIWFKLFGALFLFIGLSLLVGRFLYDAHMRTKTYFCITNKRAIILYDDRVSSVDLAHTDIHKTAYDVVFGDLFVYESLYRPGSSFRKRADYGTISPRFNTLENPQHVYDIALKAKHAL